MCIKRRVLHDGNNEISVGRILRHFPSSDFIKEHTKRGEYEYNAVVEFEKLEDKTAIKFSLNELDLDDLMLYLINTISFDAEWANLYEESDIKEGTFTDINGNKTTVDMLHSNEYGYISLENATGFIKNYNGKKFSFVALLPSENILWRNLV